MYRRIQRSQLGEDLVGGLGPGERLGPATCEAAPTGAEKFSCEVYAKLSELEAALGTILIITALIAAVTLILVQLLKLPLKAFIQRYLTWWWLRRRRPTARLFWDSLNVLPPWLSAAAAGYPKALQEPAAEAAGSPIEGGKTMSSPAHKDYASSYLEKKLSLYGPSLFLPNDLYVKQVQNATQRVLEHPSYEPTLFGFIAHGAPVSDMVVAFHIDLLARTSPKLIAHITQEQQQEGIAAAIAAAQDNVAAAVERGLDELQIRIMIAWPFAVRLTAVVVGMVTAILAGRAVGLDSWWELLVPLGLAGGYLACFVYDALSVLGALRPRRR